MSREATSAWPGPYRLRLSSSDAGNMVTRIQDVLDILRQTGSHLAPALRIGGGRPCPQRLSNREDILTLLQDSDVTRQTEKGPSSSFGVMPSDRSLRVYFSFGAIMNELLIEFARGQPINDILPLDQLSTLFKMCVVAFVPYWGCIYNGTNLDRHMGTVDASRRYRVDELPSIARVDESKVPRLVHWYNYFGAEFVERLGGRDKLLKGPVSKAEELTDCGGIIWVLQDEPFDADNPVHVARQIQAVQYLRLSEIQRFYMFT